VAELHRVLVEVELDCETQGVVVPTGPALDVVLLLADVVSGAAPAPQFGLVFEHFFVVIVAFPLVNIVI
jgi:hypothetical protein